MKLKPPSLTAEKSAIAAFIKGLVKGTKVHIKLVRKKFKTFTELLDEVEG